MTLAWTPTPTDRSDSLEDAIVRDLCERWARARRAAIARVVGERAAGFDEARGVAAAGADLHEALARAVHENSRRLGEGFARFHRVEPDRFEVARILAASGVPCVAARAEAGAGGDPRFARPGCALAGEGAVCDFWREATDGLVVGLGDGAVRYARHRSAGAGDAECVDVLFAGAQNSMRFGPLTDAQQRSLEGVSATLRLLDGSVTLSFLGLSEGTLFYSLERDGRSTLSLEAMLTTTVTRRLPGVRLLDVTPRAVLAPGDAG